jgi:hypothetical protein
MSSNVEKPNPVNLGFMRHVVMDATRGIEITPWMIYRATIAVDDYLREHQDDTIASQDLVLLILQTALDTVSAVGDQK